MTDQFAITHTLTTAEIMKIANAYRDALDNPYEFVKKAFAQYPIFMAKIVNNDAAHPYLFAGITVDMTDTEFTSILTYVKGNNLVSAIKYLRNLNRDEYGNAMPLKPAKDFVVAMRNSL